MLEGGKWKMRKLRLAIGRIEDNGRVLHLGRSGQTDIEINIEGGLGGEGSVVVSFAYSDFDLIDVERNLLQG